MTRKFTPIPCLLSGLSSRAAAATASVGCRGDTNSGHVDLMKFADLGLSDELLRAVNESGYDEPTPIQAGAIPSVLLMRDMIGKTGRASCGERVCLDG